jgi:alkanesulfonate monooxygenase SsuD/methylene tetrahydromethanopterin reductase-like flavin-dependent oxidoreductase (luciferase family)
MLDVLLEGRRFMLGLGRGVSEHEYASLGIPREKSREYFYEILDVLRLADSQERFTYHGEIFDIPATTIRPQPRHKGHLLDGAKAAFTTRRSAELAAEAGLGQMFVAGEPLDVMGQQVAQFNRIRANKGLEPDQPTALLWMYCAESQDEVEDGYGYFEAQLLDARNHYFLWNSSGFEGVAGYEEYAAKSTKSNDGDFGATNVWDQRRTQPIGTPDQIIETIKSVQEAVSLGYLVIHVFYGGMSPEKAERSLRLFAAEVLPAVHEMEAPIHAVSLGMPAPATVETT